MPKVQINYQNTKMYKIVCDDTEKFYVGHTTNFTKRKQGHKSDSKTKDTKVYRMIREFGGWENWRIVLIEKYPCNNKREAEKREEELRLESKADLNMYRCFRPNGGICTVEDCTNFIRSTTEFCCKHGGCKRCPVQDCESSAIGKTEFCRKHGPQHTCLLCDTTISIHSVKRHEKSKTHLAKILI